MAPPRNSKSIGPLPVCKATPSGNKISHLRSRDDAVTPPQPPIKKQGFDRELHTKKAYIRRRALGGSMQVVIAVFALVAGTLLGFLMRSNFAKRESALQEQRNREAMDAQGALQK